MKATSEKDLVAALQSGEEAAFEQLVRDQGPRLLTVARRMLRNEEDAREAVQEAFLSAFRGIDRFQEQSRLSTWLHRIVINAALMRIRRRDRGEEKAITDFLPRFDEEGHTLEPEAPWALNGQEWLEKREAREQVRQAIDQLPETYRTILLLRDIEGLSTEETAKQLEVSTAVVKTRLHRARQALREIVAPYFRGDEA